MQLSPATVPSVSLLSVPQFPSPQGCNLPLPQLAFTYSSQTCFSWNIIIQKMTSFPFLPCQAMLTLVTLKKTDQCIQCKINGENGYNEITAGTTSSVTKLEPSVYAVSTSSPGDEQDMMPVLVRM